MKYVNIQAAEPFGYMISEEYSSIAAAKGWRTGSQRTVNVTEARELVWADAVNPERRERLARHLRRVSGVLDENAILKNQTLGQVEPAMSMADVPEQVWTMLAVLRVALNGLGHVRPRLLADGKVSGHEVELVFTQHEVAVLLQKLSVASDKVDA